MSMSFKADPSGTFGEILVNGQVVAKLPVSGNAVIPNLVGTVSQSGGIPTGAVVERGSNANGEYVRYADGTQICWNFSLVSHGTTPAQYVKTFPAGFIAQPRVQAEGNFWNAGNSPTGWAYVKVYIEGTSGSAASFAVYSLNNSATSGNAETQYIAIGRWY